MSNSQINLSIQSPLPSLMRSSQDRQCLWNKLNLIPYRGHSKYSSHRYLKLLFELYEHSPSFGAVVNDIITFGFEGDVDLEKNSRRGIKKSNDTKLSDSDKDSFCDYIEKIGLYGGVFSDLSKIIVEHKKICGNAYLLYRRAEVNNEVRVSLKLLNPQYVMYEERNNGTVGDLIFSENFALDKSSYWTTSKEKFKNYKVYPNARQAETITETVFHIKSGNDVYGQPKGIQSVFWQYVEYALGNLSSKVTGNEYVASHLLELPTLDVGQSNDKDFQKYMKSVKKAILDVITAKGVNPSAMGLIPNPTVRDLKLHDLSVNRDTDWFNAQESTARRKIYELNGHYPQLTGGADLKSSLGQDALTAMYLSFDSKTIKPLQSKISNEWLTILDFIAEDTGNEDMKGIKPIFPTNIDDFIDNLSRIRNGKE